MVVVVVEELKPIMLLKKVRSSRHGARMTPYPTRDVLSAHDEPKTTIATPGHNRGAQTDHVVKKVRSHRHGARMIPYPTRDELSTHDKPKTVTATQGHVQGAQINHDIHATTRAQYHGVRVTPCKTSDALSSHDEPDEIGVAASEPSTQTSNIDIVNTPTMSIYHQCKKKWEFSDSYLASSIIRCCFERRMTDFWPRISYIPRDTMDILFSDFKDQFV